MHSRDHGRVIEYITDTFVEEPAWLEAVRAHGESLRPGMQLSAYEGHLLGWLSRMAGARNILEIGTFMGYSALWMARGGARVTSLEFNGEYATIAAQHVAGSPFADAVTIVQGEALSWLANQPEEPAYDMVFIDAEKRRYVDYLEAVLPLLEPRSLIVGDNSLLWGAVTGEDPKAASKEATLAMRQFNDMLGDPVRYDGLMLPTIEGLTVARMKT